MSRYAEMSSSETDWILWYLNGHESCPLCGDKIIKAQRRGAGICFRCQNDSCVLIEVMFRFQRNKEVEKVSVRTDPILTKDRPIDLNGRRLGVTRREITENVGQC